MFPNVFLARKRRQPPVWKQGSPGRFAPNTGIGWFLVPNGWNGKSVDATRNQIFYKVLNTYDKPQYQQQTLILKDATRELLLLSFEDISRQAVITISMTLSSM